MNVCSVRWDLHVFPRFKEVVQERARGEWCCDGGDDTNRGRNKGDRCQNVIYKPPECRGAGRKPRRNAKSVADAFTPSGVLTYSCLDDFYRHRSVPYAGGESKPEVAEKAGEGLRRALGGHANL